MRDRMLTIEQAAELLGTGERFVRRLVAERRIEFHRLGPPHSARGPVRISERAVRAFLDAGRVEAKVSRARTGKVA
jgi:excisionase family DNA binding protein